MSLDRDMSRFLWLPNNECGFGVTYPGRLLTYLQHRIHSGEGPTTCGAVAAVGWGGFGRALSCGFVRRQRALEGFPGDPALP